MERCEWGEKKRKTERKKKEAIGGGEKEGKERRNPLIKRTSFHRWVGLLRGLGPDLEPGCYIQHTQTIKNDTLKV